MFVLLLSLAHPASGQGKFLKYFQPSEDPYKGKFIPIPLLIYSPETSLGFGLTGQYLFRFKNTDSTSNLSVAGVTVMYTLRRQVIVHPNWDLWIDHGKFRITGDYLYQRYPDSFYGIGNDTDKDDRERYTTKYMLAKMRGLWRVAPHLYMGMQYRMEYMFKPEYEDDGIFATQDIPGEEGFRASGIGFPVVYDSRDNSLFPFKGQYITLSNHIYQDLWGSKVDFFNLKLDARAYFNPGQGSHVIAIQGMMQVNTGDPPFMMLSKLGGEELMRGHFSGRYRDKHILAGQVEYRFPIWWRFIGVAFVGVGEVAPEFKAFTLRGLKYSMGGGLRFTLDAKERINVRFDYGYGLHNNHGFYFGISEAF